MRLRIYLIPFFYHLRPHIIFFFIFYACEAETLSSVWIVYRCKIGRRAILINWKPLFGHVLVFNKMGYTSARPKFIFFYLRGFSGIVIYIFKMSNNWFDDLNLIFSLEMTFMNSIFTLWSLNNLLWRHRNSCERFLWSVTRMYSSIRNS